MIKNLKESWPGFKLRMTLFRIWFMKNILLWLQIFGIICIILIFTGTLNEKTPILGITVYPILKDLVDEIHKAVDEREINSLMNFFTAVITILTSVGMFAMKVKSIAQSDIKNDKLKVALLKANLYFNSDGKLVQKIEKLTDTDIDGDGKISESEKTVVEKGLFSGTIYAIKEFFIILKADLREKNEEDVVNEIGYADSNDALNEINKTIKNGILNAGETEMNKIVDKEIEKNETSEEDEETKKQKRTVLQKIKDRVSAFFNKFKKKEENKDAEKEKVEVVENNMNKDSDVKGSDIKGLAIGATTETKIPAAISAQPKNQKQQLSATDAFIQKLKNKQRI